MPSLNSILRSRVDPASLWRHVQYLASFERMSGTPGEERAAEYIATQLAEYGVQSQRLRFEAFLSYPLQAEMEIIEPERFSIACRPRPFTGSTPLEGLEAEVILAPPSPATVTGASTPRTERQGGKQSHAAVDCTGRIVMAIGGGPGAVVEAERNGAAAHCQSWPSTHNFIEERVVSSIWGTPTPESAARLIRMPAVTLAWRDAERVKTLCSQGRVRARLKATTFVGWRPVVLPVADIPGCAEPKFLLIGSHYCAWYDGATDNASGNACLLEMARVLALHREDLLRGVRLAWWPGHSQGRYAGSTWYADNHYADLRRNCIAYLNIDSPGVRGATVLECRVVHAELEQLVRDTVLELTQEPPLIQRPSRAGDQSFLGMGIPSLGAYRLLSPQSPDRVEGVTAGGAYWGHTPDDTVDKVDIEVLTADTQLYLSFAGRLCSASQLPFEFSTLSRELYQLLTDLCKNGAGLDLNRLLACALELGASADRLTQLGPNLSPDQTKTLNDGLVRLCRILNPVLYSVAGDYHQDPAAKTFLLPGLRPARQLSGLDLESEPYRLLVTKLVRERNRLEDALSRATAEADRLFRQLDRGV